MAFNGAGVFTRLFSWAADKAGGIKIRADKMDREMDGFAAGLSNCITRDGQSTVTADIPFNGKKITGLGNATADADALNRITADGRYAPLAAGGLSGLRNRIINGAFSINQRLVSGTVTLTAGQYGHDRWKAGASGCTYTFTTSGLDTTVTITSGSLMQIVEPLNVEGGDYRLSWTGTATARTAKSNGTTSGAYASGPLTVSSAGAGQTITVEFTLGTLTKVQLEPGSNATTFERRPVGLELSLCQRYYERFVALWTGNTTASTSYQVAVPYVVEKRASPTFTSILQNGALNGGFSARAASASAFPTRSAAVTGACTGTISAAGFQDIFAAESEL